MRKVSIIGCGGTGKSNLAVCLNRLGILVLLAFQAHLLAVKPAASQQAEEKAGPASNEMHSRKVLDIQATNAFTRAAGALHDMLQAAGHSEWSPARLQGVLGNAFSFETRKGAARVWQEASLDWWLFLQILPELDLGCRIKRFQVRHQEDALWSPGGSGSGFRPRHQDKSQALKAAAWEAVRESIDRGIPAAAWNPMSFEQAEAGLSARDWGLLVGYDLSDETYTVRHNYVRDDFTVRYDEIGHTEPSELFCVLVYEERKPGDSTAVHIEALKNAVDFANGTRYDPMESTYFVDARGFAAIELWGEAVVSGAADPELARYQIWELTELRGFAAAYLRELMGIFPVAAQELGQGASRYDRVVESAEWLQRLCIDAFHARGFSAEARADALELVRTALHSERGAVASIEAALSLVEESR